MKSHFPRFQSRALCGAVILEGEHAEPSELRAAFYESADRCATCEKNLRKTGFNLDAHIRAARENAGKTTYQ